MDWQYKAPGYKPQKFYGFYFDLEHFFEQVFFFFFNVTYTLYLAPTFFKNISLYIKPYYEFLIKLITKFGGINTGDKVQQVLA